MTAVQWLSFIFLEMIPIASTLLMWFFAIGGSYKVLRLKRSKSGYRKLKKSLTLRDRIFKHRFISLSKSGKMYQHYFIAVTYFGYLCLVAIGILFFVSRFTCNFRQMLHLFFVAKCYLFELYAAVFTVMHISIFTLKSHGTNKGGKRIILDWDFVQDKNYS